MKSVISSDPMSTYVAAMWFDYFAGAPAGWRTEAKIRARRVFGEQREDPLSYVEMRLARARFGSFEKRRWTYIRRLLEQLILDEEKRLQPRRGGNAPL